MERRTASQLECTEILNSGKGEKGAKRAGKGQWSKTRGKKEKKAR